MEWIFIRIASPDSSLPLKNVLPWTGAVGAIFRARSAPDKGIDCLTRNMLYFISKVDSAVVPRDKLIPMLWQRANDWS